MSPRERVRIDVDRLWMGFSERSVERLSEAAHDERLPSAARRDAALGLAQWYLAGNAGPAARRAVEAAAQFEGHELRRAAFDADSSVLCGQPERALDVVRAVQRVDDVDDLLRLANITRHLPGTSDREADADRLELVNRALAVAGLSSVEMRDPARRLGLANLTGSAVARPAGTDGLPAVSVIVPVRDMAPTLRYALDSVIGQTYTDLDIVVVDDASRDATSEVIRELAARDERIRHVRRQRSDGTFAARNDGLRRCVGDLVTVYDGDDWSHPEKIERQVEAMLAAGARASVSYWARATDDLEFRQPFLRPRRTYVDRNTSSLMFDRSVFDEIGVWDDVRNFGDVEFMWRYEARFGSDSIVHVDRSVPLAFGRRSTESLTGTGPNGNAGLFHVMGSLHQYRRAARRWHASDGFLDRLPHDPAAGTRPFPVPHLLDARRPPNASPADVAVLADLSGGGRRTTARAAPLRVLGERAITVALGHVPSSSGDVADRLLDLADGETIRFVSSREQVAVRLLVVDSSDVLTEPLDDPPTFAADRVIVVVDDASLLTNDADPPPDGHSPVRNLRRFGVERSEWWATDPIVLDRLKTSTVAAEPGVKVVDDLWPVAAFGVRRRRVVPCSGPIGVGVIGSPGVDVPPPVRSLAGDRIVVRARGRHADTGAGDGVVRDVVSKVSLSEFLDRIDVAVWLPDDAERSPVAMACAAANAGVPLVTTHVMEPAFGDAALYTDVDDLGRVIDELVLEPERYAYHSRRSRALVRRRHGPDAIADHLVSLATAPIATVPAATTDRAGRPSGGRPGGGGLSGG